MARFSKPVKLSGKPRVPYFLRVICSIFPSRKVLFTLLRLPNLFTIPGDILIGWCTGGMRGGFPFFGIVASLCLYSCGLLLNDLCDAKIDARERPSRPIPSGKVSKGFVFCATLFLALFGILFAVQGMTTAIGLLGLILFYNIFAKHIPWIGVITMGLCRGCNILLGVAVSWPWGKMPLPQTTLLAAGFFTLYILIVSIVAKNEVQPQTRLTLPIRLLPIGLILLLIPGWWLFADFPHPIATLLCAGALTFIVLLPAKLPIFVGRLILYLIPLQCLWCSAFTPLLPTLLFFGVLYLAALYFVPRYAAS